MKIGFRSVAFLAAAAVVGQNAATTKIRTITAKESRELVLVMLKADDWTKLPGFNIEEPQLSQTYPEFFEVDARYDNPQGSSTVGTYAVEQTTGEVWSFPVCGRYESPALLVAQRVLRKRIGLTDATYQSLRKPGPFCRRRQVPLVLKMARPTLDNIPLKVDKGK